MSTPLTSLNPATGQPIWEGQATTPEAVHAAVAAAARAFPAWHMQPVEARIAVVERFKTLLEAQTESFGTLIAEETGKPLWDAKGEVQAMVNKAALSIRAHAERTGEKSAEQAGVQQTLRHRAHGVMAVFGPYNFPGHLPNGHIMPALIAGNTVVFKPSDQTPAVGERMAALWHEAGLPEGVLHVVQGGRAVGEALAAAPIQGVLFTGSAAVGALLHKQLGGRPEIMLALEMGGNNPLIAWDAEDIHAAALLVIQSAYLSTGQRCTCARRLIVPSTAWGDALLEAVRAWIPRLTIGAHTDQPEPFMGPLINAIEAEKLLAAQAALLSQDAVALARMEQLKPGTPFLTPALLDVTAVRAREDREYFGPMLQVVRVNNFEEALHEANATRFGLAAGLISHSRERYNTFLAHIHAGVVNWNRPTNGASSALPFGGVGISGNHRPSAYYAADYCAYPIASLESDAPTMPATLPTGVRA